METTYKQYVGLDIHKRFIHAAVMDKEGCIIFEERIPTEPKFMKRFLTKINKEAEIAIESCICWEHIFDYIDDAGYRNLHLANPSRIGLISTSDKKTDSHDAKVLANLVRTNLLPLSYAPTIEIRNQRRLTRFRASLGRIQAVIKNKIHAILIRNGIHNPYNNAFVSKSIEYLKTLELDWADRIQMDEYIYLFEQIDVQKKKTEKTINDYVEHDYFAKLLTSIPGIASYSALMISAEIGDIRRFKSAKKLVSYAGLNPRVSQSGDTCHIGPISKKGDKHLRWILGQCANIAIMHDSTLSKFYHRLKKKKGHNKAITATARKMLCYIFTMLSNNIKYQQLQAHKKKAS